jgi:hypothetical protein
MTHIAATNKIAHASREKVFIELPDSKLADYGGTLSSRQKKRHPNAIFRAAARI